MEPSRCLPPSSPPAARGPSRAEGGRQEAELHQILAAPFSPDVAPKSRCPYRPRLAAAPPPHHYFGPPTASPASPATAVALLTDDGPYPASPATAPSPCVFLAHELCFYTFKCSLDSMKSYCFFFLYFGTRHLLLCLKPLGMDQSIRTHACVLLAYFV